MWRLLLRSVKRSFPQGDTPQCHCCRSESTSSCLSPVTTAFFLGFEDFLLMRQCFVGMLKYKLGAWILQEDVLEIILLRECENENLPQLSGVF